MSDMDPIALWPTLIVHRRHPDADAVNPALIELFHEITAGQKGHSGPTFASPDDLLRTHGGHPAIQSLFGFLSDTVFRAAHTANEAVWSELGTPRVRVVVIGAWYQRQNHGGSHGIHNHGNCSWSGVYYIDVDPPDARRAHPRLGSDNGITRFHGPRLNQLGGAHMDLGSIYLQRSSYDIAPEPGAAVIFPSWLLHEVLPYEGTRDRLIISFNAQVHAKDGPKSLPFAF